MRRAGLALALVLGVALLFAAVVATPPRGDPALARFPSTESTWSGGVAGAARWLEATGRPHRRWVGAATPPAAGEAWLLLSPAAPLGDREVQGLLDHAEAGGLVVWALGDGGEHRQPALARRLQARRVPGRGLHTAAPLSPHPLFDGISLRLGGAGVACDAPGARTVLGDAGWAAAVAVPVGRGEVLLLAGPELLDNGHLAEPDALDVWVRLASRGPLVFDERFLRPAAAGLVAGAGPLAPFGLQLGLLVLLLGAALWPRLGAIRPPPPPGPGRTTRDYLAALAELYRRAGAEPELAAAAWERLRRRLEREAGVAAGLPVEEAVRRLAPTAPAMAEPLRRGAAALARGGPGCLLAVTRAAADVRAARRWRGR